MPIELTSKSFEVSIFKTSIWSGVSKFLEERTGSSFDPFSLHVFCTPPVEIGGKLSSVDDFVEELEDIKRLGLSIDRTVEELVKKTALAHEARHFHDLLCTPYGIQTFLNNHEVFTKKCIIDQLSLIKEIEERDGKSKIFVDPEDSLLAGFLQENTLNQLNLAKDPILFREGHEKEVDYYEITFTDLQNPVKIPCVFSNIMVDTGERLTAIWPINFTLITECLATIEQEEWIASVGDEYAERYRFLSREANPMGPYLPLLITYIRANNRIGNHEPHQAFLYSACSTSLFSTEVWNDDPQKNFCSAGWRLIDLLNGCPSDELGKKEIWPERPDYEQVEESLQRAYRHYTGNSPILGAYRTIIGEYGLKTVDVINGHQFNYNTKAGYLFFQKHLPPPPAIFFSDGGLQINDETLYEFCVSQIFLRDAYAQLAEGADFVCPVRYGTDASIFSEPNYPSGETCIQGIASNACGFWDAREKYTGPTCFWTHYIGQLTKMISASDRWKFKREKNDGE